MGWRENARIAANTLSNIRGGMSASNAGKEATTYVQSGARSTKEYSRSSSSRSSINTVQPSKVEQEPIPELVSQPVLSPHLQSNVNPFIHSRPTSDINAKFTPLSETVQYARDTYKPEYTPEEQIVMRQRIGGGSETLMYRPDLRAKISQSIDAKEQLESISAMQLGGLEPTAQKYEDGVADALDPLTGSSIGPVRALGGVVETFAYLPTAIPRLTVGLARNPTATVRGATQGLAETVVTDPWRGGGQILGIVAGPKLAVKVAKIVPRGVRSSVHGVDLKYQAFKNERTLINMANKDPLKQPGPVTEAVQNIRFDAEVIHLRSKNKINDALFDLEVNRLKGQEYMKNSISDLMASDQAQVQLSEPAIKAQQLLKPVTKEVVTSRPIQQTASSDIFTSVDSQLASKSKIFSTQEQLTKGPLQSQVQIHQPLQVGFTPFVNLQPSLGLTQKVLATESYQESLLLPMLDMQSEVVQIFDVLQISDQKQSPYLQQKERQLPPKYIPDRAVSGIVEIPELKLKGVPQITARSKKRRSKRAPDPLSHLDKNLFNKYNNPLKMGAAIDADVRKLLKGDF